MARRGIKRCARRSLPRRGRALYAGVAAGVGGGLAALAPPRQPRRARGRRPASPPRPGALRRAPSVVPPVGVRLLRGRWRAPLLRSPRPGGPAPSLRPGPRRRVSLPCRGRSAPGSVPGRGSPPRVGAALLSVVGWRRPLHRRGGAGRAGGAPFLGASRPPGGVDVGASNLDKGPLQSVNIWCIIWSYYIVQKGGANLLSWSGEHTPCTCGNLCQPSPLPGVAAFFC